MSQIPSATTAGEILNRVAAEVGIAPTQSPYSSTDKTFVQLQYLLRTAGEELALMHPWQQFQIAVEFVTQAGDTGNYDLPADFNYILNQTPWETGQSIPVFGPLSPQEWSALVSRDTGASVYVMFRIQNGQLRLYPQPPAEGLTVRYEYVSRYWALDGTTPTVRILEPVQDSDIVQFDRTLITRYVKVKYLEAHGLDSMKAQDDLNQIFGVTAGQSGGATILDAGGGGIYATRYLDGHYNAPGTGFG